MCMYSGYSREILKTASSEHCSQREQRDDKRNGTEHVEHARINRTELFRPHLRPATITSPSQQS